MVTVQGTKMTLFSSLVRLEWMTKGNEIKSQKKFSSERRKIPKQVRNRVWENPQPSGTLELCSVPGSISSPKNSMLLCKNGVILKAPES